MALCSQTNKKFTILLGCIGVWLPWEIFFHHKKKYDTQKTRKYNNPYLSKSAAVTTTKTNWNCQLIIVNKPAEDQGRNPRRAEGETRP